MSQLNDHASSLDEDRIRLIVHPLFFMTSSANISKATGAILAAGGSGTRLGASIPKQLLPLAGIPVLARSCLTLLEIDLIWQIVVVVPDNFSKLCQDILQDHLNIEHFSRLAFATGGSTRQESVEKGLKRLAPEIGYVLVHDAARPLVNKKTIVKCLQIAMQFGAAISALPVKDTLKRVETGTGIIQETIDRSQLWQAQTPQVMRRDLLEEAFACAHRDTFTGTDEASLLEHAGIPVRVVQGTTENFKITHSDDLVMAEALMQKTEHTKIGHGFDAHCLVSERKLILGGVHIDFDLGLAGHSDADVVAHALADAILGALGLGDIGRHFPDTDQQYKGADSLLLLQKIWTLAEKNHFILGNADITIICQRPKLMPYIPQMQQNLAFCCKTLPENMNIKATTTEKMGFTGRGEGISTHAIVLLKKTHEN